MTISYLGHSCFRIEAKEGSVLIDPFSKEIGLRAPKIKDDIVLISHAHEDHNNVADINEGAFLIINPGEYEKNGISIQGISSFHDNNEGRDRGYNTIYVIRAEDMTICHLGDFGESKLSDRQVELISDVDVLMVPVGGTYTINAKEAVGIITQVEPKMIIPMHFKTKDLRLDIEGPEKFIKELSLKPEKVDKLKISKKLLPTEETKLIVFEE